MGSDPVPFLTNSAQILSLVELAADGELAGDGDAHDVEVRPLIQVMFVHAVTEAIAVISHLEDVVAEAA